MVLLFSSVLKSREIHKEIKFKFCHSGELAGLEQNLIDLSERKSTSKSRTSRMQHKSIYGNGTNSRTVEWVSPARAGITYALN